MAERAGRPRQGPRRPAPGGPAGRAGAASASARGVALDALVAIDAGGRANVVVPAILSRSGLERRDRDLVTELVYGTCRMRRACDWLTGRHLARRPPDADVVAALRLGAYQLGWTRIAHHAAVSATVGEVRGPGRSLVNAVLRKVATDVAGGLTAWPDAATELSYPDWIVERLTADIGPGPAREALRTMNEPAEVCRRPDGYIQDTASQMVSAHVAALVGAGLVLDMCAAPGGKATAIALAGASVVASDVSPARSRTVAANIASLGAEHVWPVVSDGAAAPFAPGAFDAVLVDAPCSGLGVLRRRPDARWRVKPDDLDRLSELQRTLLSSAATLVRPGGVVAYSVCTLSSSETAAIDNWAARAHPGLAPLPPPGQPWSPAGRGALLLPQTAGTDGMYLLCLRRKVA